MYKAKAAAGSHIPCVIDDLKQEEEKASTEHVSNAIGVGVDALRNVILSPDEGQGTMGMTPFDVVLSPIKPASGWADAPEDALEFTLLMSKACPSGGACREKCTGYI